MVKKAIFSTSLVLLALVGFSCNGVERPDNLNAGGSTLSGITELTIPVNELRTIALPIEADPNTVASTSPASLEITEVTDGSVSLRGKSYGVTAVSYALRGTTDTQLIPVLVKGERPTIALEYFAPHNVAPDGQQLLTIDDNQSSGYFDYNGLSTLKVNGYRLPTRHEWSAIAPYQTPMEYGGVAGPKYGLKEPIEVRGVTKWYSEDRYNTGKGVAYALRFKACPVGGGFDAQGIELATDDSMLTAYKYEYTPVDADAKEFMLKITARYLGPNFTGDLSYVASEGFWHTCTAGDIVMTLPATGLRDLTDAFSTKGFTGSYWSAKRTENGQLWSWSMEFDHKKISQTNTADKAMRRAVRLIKE